MRPMLRASTSIGVFVLTLTALGSAGPARAADPAPLCIYEGNSFSEGAHICAQASLMMSCTMVGERAVWKVVTEREVSRLCVTPSSRADTSVRSRRHVARYVPSASAAPSVDLPATGSAKCFTFNGKRFCE